MMMYVWCKRQCIRVCFQHCLTSVCAVPHKQRHGTLTFGALMETMVIERDLVPVALYRTRKVNSFGGDDNGDNDDGDDDNDGQRKKAAASLEVPSGYVFTGKPDGQE